MRRRPKSTVEMNKMLRLCPRKRKRRRTGLKSEKNMMTKQIKKGYVLNKSVHPYDVRCVDKGIDFLPFTSFVSIDSLSSGSIIQHCFPFSLSVVCFPLSECECVGQVMHSPRND